MTVGKLYKLWFKSVIIDIIKWNYNIIVILTIEIQMQYQLATW